MSAADEIMQRVPLDQIAQELGVDRPTAERAVAATLPALIGTLHDHAQSPEGEQSLAGLLQQPGDADPDSMAAAMFGHGRHDATQQAAQQAGVSDGLIRKLLPLLAPIVLAYLAQRMQQQGGLGSILGQILGHGHDAAPAPQSPAPQPSSPEPQSNGTGDPTFQEPPASGPTGDPTGGLRMDPGDGSTPGIDPEPQQNDQEASSAPQGGGLGQILGQILGGRH